MTAGALTSPRVYLVLAAFQAGDAVASAIPLPFIAKILDDLGVPPRIRWIIPVSRSETKSWLCAGSKAMPPRAAPVFWRPFKATWAKILG